MLKLRTMFAGAEMEQTRVNIETEEGEIIHKRVDDPRVTRVLRTPAIDQRS